MNLEIYNRYETNQLDSKSLRIGVIGMGNMGKAFVKGIASNELFDGEVLVCNRTSDATIERLKNEELSPKIQIIEDNASVVRASDVIFVCLKQAQMHEELIKWSESGVLLDGQLLVSCAAGIRIGTIKKWLGNENQPVVRVMPNTPAAVEKGVFGWTVSDEVTVGQKKQLEKIFSSVGTQIYVEREEEIDIITALSGSGPAYFYKLTEIMIKAAIEMGLDAQSARIAAYQTLIGAAVLFERRLKDSPDIDLVTLRENITSKGGTTEAAIQKFRDMGFEDTVIEAMRAAKNRAEEIAEHFDAM